MCVYVREGGRGKEGGKKRGGDSDVAISNRERERLENQWTGQAPYVPQVEDMCVRRLV